MRNKCMNSLQLDRRNLILGRTGTFTYCFAKLGEVGS